MSLVLREMDSDDIAQQKFGRKANFKTRKVELFIIKVTSEYSFFVFIMYWKTEGEKTITLVNGPVTFSYTLHLCQPEVGCSQ